MSLSRHSLDERALVGFALVLGGFDPVLTGFELVKTN